MTYDKQEDNKTVLTLKNEHDCYGCWACITSCPKKAIYESDVGMGASIPLILDDLCIRCGACKTVCDKKSKPITNTHVSYVALNKDDNQRKMSASGGAFSAIATSMLESGGVVFGAEIKFIANSVTVEHQMIEYESELYRILGSKYVQSDCRNAMVSVKEQLKKGKGVLFSGTSCQIAGLYSYLRMEDISNLYTIDLICHGVPGIELFREYIRYNEQKYKSNIKSFYFRKKRNGYIEYTETICMECNGKEKIIVRPSFKSAYYQMFREAENYRLACYSCEYATIDKPSDITIGDYFGVEKDYPELFNQKFPLNKADGISCLITHTSKGEQLIGQCKQHLQLFEANCDKVCLSHSNLSTPSKYTKRDMLLKLYQKNGYSGIEKYYAAQRPKIYIKNIQLWIWKKIKNNRVVVNLKNTKTVKRLMK